MKAIWIAAVLCTSLCAERPEDSRVPICIGAGSMSGTFVLNRARGLAGKMFAEIGVTVVWRGSDGCPANAIRITFSQKTSPKLLPGTFAYARPYEGTHIEVFFDRVLNEIAERGRVPSLLAHVLVHEIAHVLEGTDYHSDTGVMKAHWDKRDYEQMADRCLKFTPRDVMLIQAGLSRRRSLQGSQSTAASR